MNKNFNNQHRYHWCDYAVENGARAAEIDDKVQEALDKYLIEKDVKVLETIMDEKPAHVIDVIFKECLRTYESEDLFAIEKPFGGASFTGTFYTDYSKFDKDKVFFEGIEGDEYMGTFNFPITIERRGKEHRASDFDVHNYFYPKHYGAHIGENGLLEWFYQDIDIFGDEDTWKEDLIKALYRVVLAAYWYWQEQYDCWKCSNDTTLPCYSVPSMSEEEICGLFLKDFEKDDDDENDD